MSHNDTQQDARVRFLFEDAPVRGAWVYLQHSVQAMPAFISASPAGKILLGESVAAAALLSANIKLQGRLAIQARGDGALRLLVVGGSLGAKALNEVVPKALALLPSGQRPMVRHQSGEHQIDAQRAAYTEAGVEAELTPFIQDTAEAFAQADLVVCRAGASTVTEIAAVGAAAVFVPFPFAVDDHQTTNAGFLVDQGAGWLVQQDRLSPERLAHMLSGTDRAELLDRAQKAWNLRKTHATDEVVAACEELAR